MSTNEIMTFAHGRVNLIGEHTDYNGGWVLPTTIPQRTKITLRPRSDSKAIAHSSASGPNNEALSTTYEIGREKPTGSWIDYLQGATFLLAKAGHRVSGFEVHVESNIPMGSGLSSSAALEVSFLKALRESLHLNLTDIEIARLGQSIENEFVGARVGIMDQMACALARSGEALFLDTRDLSYERVQLPLEDVDLLVINSGVAHRLSSTDGGYNQRRAECEEAARLLGVKELRDLTTDDLSKVDRLHDTLKRRARHVITENTRVHRAVQAIREKNMAELGRLFLASHASMRDDYNVSIPEIDFLVETCMKDKDVYGARLTGGGFGGSIVAITKAGKAAQVGLFVVDAYTKAYPAQASVLVP